MTLVLCKQPVEERIEERERSPDWKDDYAVVDQRLVGRADTLEEAKAALAARYEHAGE